ncbi:hypothetical protein ElyMa_002422500 [Elysia marginata]|uniref:PHD-type domain-containing protein n=1 Tax=Elysia marginata TaxID=1093978 RepID=A0AAV4GFY5_9GAST|nr:hypothetical protein ElyMa_002422500 [Elysia marginata]
MNRGLPCWHMMAFRLESQKTAWCLEEIPNRWHLSTFKSCLQDVVPSGHGNLVRVTEATDIRPKTEMEKRKDSVDLWQNLQPVKSACGQKVFSERCKVLKVLENVWRHGQEVGAILRLSSDHQIVSNEATYECEHDEDKDVSDETERQSPLLSSIVGGFGTLPNASVELIEPMESAGPASEDISVELQEELSDSSSQVIETDTSTPEFFLVPMIKKRGRAKAARMTSLRGKGKKRPKLCASGTTTENEERKAGARNPLLQKLPQKIQCSQVDLIVDDEVARAEHAVCFECVRQVVDKQDCEESEYTEFVMCDVCNRWFHQFCISGSSKITRGVKFTCDQCKRGN